jgi:hypothetical protein
MDEKFLLLFNELVCFAQPLADVITFCSPVLPVNRMMLILAARIRHLRRRIASGRRNIRFKRG